LEQLGRWRVSSASLVFITAQDLRVEFYKVRANFLASMAMLAALGWSAGDLTWQNQD
jgi:hypothetical protein